MWGSGGWDFHRDVLMCFMFWGFVFHDFIIWGIQISNFLDIEASGLRALLISSKKNQFLQRWIGLLIPIRNLGPLIPIRTVGPPVPKSLPKYSPT